MNKPWEQEETPQVWEHLGYTCAIVRPTPNTSGHLCGYVGIPSHHPLHRVRYNDKSKYLTKTAQQCLKENPGKRSPLVVFMTILRMDDEYDWEPHTTMEASFDIHGSVTYTEDNLLEVDPYGDMRLWWVGFDCGHANDYCPAREDWGFSSNYKDLAYVKAETEKLAEYLREIENDSLRG